MCLPDDDPAFTLKNVMEEMDFTALLAQYSGKGKSGFNPIMQFGVLTYAAMRGVREIDRIVELCKRQVRDVIEKNRKRKHTKHKKISNNSRIEIDHCSPLVLNRHRSTEKVYKEFMMYAIGRNINKYHRFLSSKLERFEGKKEENIA